MEYNPLLLKMFENRGYSPEFLQSLDKYDPDEILLHAPEFCEKLRDLHEARTHIVFLPDFDMDGIMSGVIGFAGLAELGFRVSLFIPDPKEGYGFDRNVVDRLVKTYPDVGAIVTADVGITCYDGIAAAKERGIQVLVTDHHMPARALPEADIIVDPLLPDETYSNSSICGANVIYQVLQLYANTYCDTWMVSQIRRLRVFAGIGTISDSMLLAHGNRSLVRNAVSICKLVYSNGNDFAVNSIQGSVQYRRAFKGLYLMLCLFADAGKLPTLESLDEDFFGYYLAPAFNSVKRMGGDMSTAFGVFFGNEPEEDANQLFVLNENRKVLVDSYYNQILNQTNPWAPYLYICDAPDGILGLLATRLMDTGKGPCLVVRRETSGNIHGSGRSPSWYPFLERANGHGCQGAGHNAAFGVTMNGGISGVDECFEFLTKDSENMRSRVDPGVFKIVPDFIIDHNGGGDTGINIILFLEFMDELKQFKPFGVGFEAPRILLKFKATDGEWQTLGSAQQHLKIRLPYGFDVLVWNAADKLSWAGTDREVALFGSLNLNEFRNTLTVQFIGDFV